MSIMGQVGALASVFSRVFPISYKYLDDVVDNLKTWNSEQKIDWRVDLFPEANKLNAFQI